MVKIFDIAKKHTYACHSEAKKLEIRSNVIRFKSAFTLAEVLVGMLIMSVFFLATTKVLTVKQKPLVQEYPHGYYECYNWGGLKEHRMDAGQTTIAANTPVTSCTFVPLKGLPVFNVYVAHQTRGFYATTETQINDDDMIFNGADDLITKYGRTMDTQEERNKAFMPSDLNSRFLQFKNYLNISHPQSVLATRWTGTLPPFNAVFISW